MYKNSDQLPAIIYSAGMVIYTINLHIFTVLYSTYSIVKLIPIQYGNLIHNDTVGSVSRTMAVQNFLHLKAIKCKITVGKRNYFTGYGILLHELPVVAVLFTQSNNNEGTMKNSILHEMFCKSLFRTSRLIVK